MRSLEPREFPINVVATLTVDADREFCTQTQLHDVLGHLLGYVPVYSELHAAELACRPAVLEQHPFLAECAVPPPGASDTAILQWISDLARTHGETLVLTPLPDEQVPDELPPQPTAEPLVVAEPGSDT